MTDPIVEEVRKYRNEHAKQFNYDLGAIVADLMKSQESHKDRLVRLKPRFKTMPTKSSSERADARPTG
jgi:hypothetical protein